MPAIWISENDSAAHGHSPQRHNYFESILPAIALTSSTGNLEANQAAISYGQPAAISEEFFAGPMLDAAGRAHAVVNRNVVILRANCAAQMLNTIDLLGQDPELTILIFSRVGQSVSNNAEANIAEVRNRTSQDLDSVAILVAGSDATVRIGTHKFSALGS